MGKLIVGIVERRFRAHGADGRGLSLTSGALRKLELLKTRLLEEQRRKINASIERISPR